MTDNSHAFINYDGRFDPPENKEEHFTGGPTRDQDDWMFEDLKNFPDTIFPDAISEAEALKKDLDARDEAYAKWVIETHLYDDPTNDILRDS